MKNLRYFFGLFLIATLLAACGGSSAVNPPYSAQTLSQTKGFGMKAAASGYKQLYAFKGTPDGSRPFSGLIAVNGTLYGTTLQGSRNYCISSCEQNECYLGCGTVFSVTPAGSERIVYNFRGNFGSAGDGSQPLGGLTLFDGQLYGTTTGGGAYGPGTVFTVSTSGSESVLYSFNYTDGYIPEAQLTPFKGKLWGTTVYGGSGCGSSGCGLVFSVTTAGTESVLYSFRGGRNGQRVYAPVTPLGNYLYGATSFGGRSGCGGGGCGTIFQLDKRGRERVLHRFSGGPDGEFPNGLTAVGGVLYGTTEAGAARGSGTFFSITPSGKLTTLYTFQDVPDAAAPNASLIWYKGNFYGTTIGGGTASNGTVFKVTKTGTEHVLYSFMGGSDGSDPGPVFAFNGKLYGTTTSGGTGCPDQSGCGTIYRVNP